MKTFFWLAVMSPVSPHTPRTSHFWCAHRNTLLWDLGVKLQQAQLKVPGWLCKDMAESWPTFPSLALSPLTVSLSSVLSHSQLPAGDAGRQAAWLVVWSHCGCVAVAVLGASTERRTLMYSKRAPSPLMKTPTEQPAGPVHFAWLL